MPRHMSMKQWALAGVLAVAACGGVDTRPAQGAPAVGAAARLVLTRPTSPVRHI